MLRAAIRKYRRLFLCSLLTGIMAAGCSSGPQPSPMPAPKPLPKPAPKHRSKQTPKHAPMPAPRYHEEVGRASYYGKKFNGRKTASGERYDMHALTAAHPRLPFGTLVTVTNVKNGRSVSVRINDRGPFIRGRIIDLSYAAAKRLGMLSRGVTRVRVRWKVK
jgi:rare lipoprotein A